MECTVDPEEPDKTGLELIAKVDLGVTVGQTLIALILTTYATYPWADDRRRRRKPVKKSYQTETV
jgi:hypothetical protein